MRLVHLTVAVLMATFFAVTTQGIRGQGTEKDCSPCGKSLCDGRGCDDRSGDEHCSHGERFSHDGHCSNQDCMIGRYGYGKTPICETVKAGEVCPVHGYGPCPEGRSDFARGLRQAMAPADRPYFGMQPLIQPRPLFPYGRYGGYGPYGNGPNGYGQHGSVPYGYGQHGSVPYGYGQHGSMPYGYGQPGNGPHDNGQPDGMYPPPPPPRFPVLHSLFVQPPIYMTTAPQPPMPTYTTRGPRDFLNPNPPSIGY